MVKLEGQRGRPGVRRRPDHAAALVPARRARADRHQVRLRRRRCAAPARCISTARRCAPASTAVGDAEGQQVVTIEGLSPDGNHPVQVAWRELNVPQCGFCQTGQIMQAAGLLAAEPDADRRGDHRGDGRQHLPLRLLPAHPRGGPRRCHGSVSHVALSEPASRAGSQAIGRARDHRERQPARASSRAPPRAAAWSLACSSCRSTRRRVRAYPTGGHDMPNGIVTDPQVFVSIAPDGTVTIVAAPLRDGHRRRAPALPMVVADEMEADWARVRIVQAPGDEPNYGNQDTDGSRSMRHYIQPMRQCGAAVRADAGGGRGQAVGRRPAARSRAVNHEVAARGVGRKLGYGDRPRLGYGELRGRRWRCRSRPSRSSSFKDESEFRYIGKGNVPIDDLHDITTGKAIYGADVTPARHEVRGGRAAAGGRRQGQVGRRQRGAEGAGRREGRARSRARMPPAKFAPLGGVAVIANNTWAAIKGREALKIEWDDGPHGSYDTEPYHKEMSATAAQARQGRCATRAMPTPRSPSAAKVDQRRVLPAAHGAHRRWSRRRRSPTSPTARCEVWAPVQSPYGTRAGRRQGARRADEDVTVNVTLLGGGFGRKSKCDFVLEAALLSSEVGAPVKVEWTREDDIRHGFYHTTSVERIEAALDADSKVVGWRHRSVAPTILSTFAADTGYPVRRSSSAWAWSTCRSTSPNIRMENGKAMAHTRIGWFRSVSNMPHAFAVQSFVGRARARARHGPEGLPARADRAGADHRSEGGRHRRRMWNYGEPYETFPIDTGRLRSVVELAAEKAGWGKQLPEGRRARHRRAPQLRHLRRHRGPRGGRTTTARSRCPRSTPRSTAASASIPSGSARRSRAPR